MVPSGVDEPGVRLVDATDQRLGEGLAVEVGGIAEARRDGLMAVAVEAGLATAVAIMNAELHSPMRGHDISMG